MNKKQVLIDETLYYEKLDNGLEVYLHPKNGFVDFHATLQVQIGGNALSYQYGNEFFNLPAGTAHFLEHVYFENDGVNLSDEFSQYNADINASTSREVTKYYFSAQENFDMILNRFLEHFSSVCISEKTIEKERNIIEKEILMYDDNLYTQVNERLLKQMYKDERIWVDIAGTVKNVGEIDKLILDRTVNHFYQPNNMILVLTGPFDPETIMNLIKHSPFNTMKSNQYSPQINHLQDGKSKRHIYEINEKQNVNYLMVGVKLDLSIFEHLEVSQKRLVIIMFFEYFFSESSENYKQLKEDNLINYMYGTHIKIMDDYAYFSISSESNKPKVLKNRLIDMFKHLGLIEKKIFIASIRSRVGHFIGYFDSAYSINYSLTDFIKKRIDISSYINNVENISMKDVELTKKSIQMNEIYSVIYARN
ncbi:MAG: insulinase family protein [Tenericutes bacterium]|nr:insulinase family protein [Mycoplasmatota bacterium]